MGRSWIFHLAAGCFCSVSGMAKHKKNNYHPLLLKDHVFDALQPRRCTNHTLYIKIKKVAVFKNEEVCTISTVVLIKNPDNHILFCDAKLMYHDNRFIFYFSCDTNLIWKKYVTVNVKINSPPI